MMDIFREELTSGLPDARQSVHVPIRLLAATLLDDHDARMKRMLSEPFRNGGW